MSMAQDRGVDDDVRLHWRPTSGPAATSPLPELTSGQTTDAGDATDQWTVARWRREGGKVVAFIAVLCLLEGANWYLLTAAFGWVLQNTVLPGVAALALIIVLVGTVLSGSLLANPALRSHRLRLRITLVGLVALQFLVNTVEGFIVARARMPLSAAEFFGLDPVMVARLAGVVLGGSLALITFSYLMLVAQILEEMLPPPNLQREAELLLRRYERLSARIRARTGTPHADLPQAPVDPTVPMPAPDHLDSETVPATRFWRSRRH